jgi:hypothetical protein
MQGRNGTVGAAHVGRGRIDRHQNGLTHFDLPTRLAFPSSVGVGEIGRAFKRSEDACDHRGRLTGKWRRGGRCLDKKKSTKCGL